MLSVDNYAHDGAGTQGYNRYSYAHNNPLKYTDPDGELPHILVGAIVGGTINLITHWNKPGLASKAGVKGGAWIDRLAAFGIGAAAGAVVAATGGAAGAGGLGSAMAAGATGSLQNTMITGIGNAVYFGETDALSPKNLLISAVVGAATGGASYKYAQWKSTVSTKPSSSPTHDYFDESKAGSLVDDLTVSAPAKTNVAEFGVKGINDGVYEKFVEHGFAKNRHIDLGLSKEAMSQKGYDFVNQNLSMLKEGDNTIRLTINGIDKTIMANVKDGFVRSINMYSGPSGRISKYIIDFGNINW